MVKFTTKLIGDKKLQRKMNRLVNRHPVIAFEATRDAAFEGIKILKKTTPRKTGKARRGWLYKRIALLAFEIYNNVPYVKWLEGGTKYFKGFFMVKNAQPKIRRKLKKEFFGKLRKLLGR